MQSQAEVSLIATPATPAPSSPLLHSDGVANPPALLDSPVDTTSFVVGAFPSNHNLISLVSSRLIPPYFSMPFHLRWHPISLGNTHLRSHQMLPTVLNLRTATLRTMPPHRSHHHKNQVVFDPLPRTPSMGMVKAFGVVRPTFVSFSVDVLICCP
jgi:hypothetical protein